MGSVNLDNTGSGADVTLSSDGTNLLLDGTAIGGGGGSSFTLVKENYSNDTAPNVTGNDSVGIGGSVVVSASDSVAMGYLAKVEGAMSVAIGLQAHVTTGATQAIAIGDNAKVNAGTSGVALGTSYVEATDAFAAVIGTNSSSYGAKSANAIAMGYQAKATASGAMAFGDRNTASGEDAVVFGESNTGSGFCSFTAGRSNTNSGSRGIALGTNHTVSSFYTFASGSTNTASESYAHAVGSKSLANRQGKFAHASLGFGTVGDSQYGRMILSKATTDATATVLTAIQGNAASSVSMPVIPSGGAQAFSGLVVAKQTSSANAAAWEIKGLIVNNGGTTTLVNSSITVIDNTPSWGGPALSADDTNDWLAITCTGAAATSIRWSCTLNTSELIYA